MVASGTIASFRQPRAARRAALQYLSLGLARRAAVREATTYAIAECMREVALALAVFRGEFDFAFPLA